MHMRRASWKQTNNHPYKPHKCHSYCFVIGPTSLQSLLSIHGIVINRLRIGHTRLTNSYLLKGENQPECQACQSSLTVKHILIECTHLRLSAVRQRYFRVDMLIFAERSFWNRIDCRNIIAFIKDIHFYHYIWCLFYISSIVLILPTILPFLINSWHWMAYIELMCR